jgi:hypothetical protein
VQIAEYTRHSLNCSRQEYIDFLFNTGDSKYLDEPEGKAEGGIIGYANNRSNYFIGGFIRPLMAKIRGIISPVQPTPSAPEIPLTLLERYQKYLSQPTPGTSDEFYNQYKKNIEGKADGGRIGFSKGKRVKSSIDKLLEQLNKKTKGKKSMESVDPKTGEVTIPKKPIRKAEEPTGMTTMDPEPEIIDERSITKTKKKTSQRYDQGMIKAANNIFPDYDDPKIAADQIAESYAQMKLGKNYEDLTSQEQNKIYSQAYDYVMDRKRGKAYKQGDPITEENFGNTPFAPSQETLDNLKKAREMTKGMSLEEEMNMVLNQYDKSMFVKNEQGMVDVTNPENVQKMAILLKKDHPEIYKTSATIDFNYPIDNNSFSQNIKLFYPVRNKQLPYTISYSAGNFQAYIQADIKPLPDHAQYLELDIDFLSKKVKIKFP